MSKSSVICGLLLVFCLAPLMLAGCKQTRVRQADPPRIESTMLPLATDRLVIEGERPSGR